MKKVFVVAFLIVLSGLFAYNFQSSARVGGAVRSETGDDKAENFPLPAEKQPVLVELFTSEGCATCPPADKLLARLDADQSNPNAEVITLSLHVDYWDSPGWKDPFSSLAFSKRQDIYSQRFKGDNYTPQMIVDGSEAFIGSDANKAEKAIANAAKMPKAKIELVQIADKIKIKIANAPAHENATVFLAIVEDNLSASVKGGENSGRKLTHTSVVRELKSLGILSQQQNELELENTVQFQPAWKKENLKFVVFLQENQTRKIFGIGKINLLSQL